VKTLIPTKHDFFIDLINIKWLGGQLMHAYDVGEMNDKLKIC
jgi:hypothetical protein